MTIMRWSCTACGERTTAGRPCPCGCVTSKLDDPPEKRPSFGQRRTPVKPVNKERKARVHPAQFGDQARLCRLSPCSVPKCTKRPPYDVIEPDHRIHRRGTAGGLDKDCWPLCVFHHRQRHDLELARFEAKHGVSSEVVAGRMFELARDHECTEWKETPEKGPIRCGVCLRNLPAEVTP